jgi:uncharacterized protein (TIGR00369 family)
MDSCADRTLDSEELQRYIMSRSNNPEQFAGYNQIQVTHVDENGAEGELKVTAHSLNAHGFVHGGCLAALCDTIGGAAVAGRGFSCVTVSYGMNFLRPAVGSLIRCKAVPEKVGKTICVYHVALTDEKERKVASGSFTFYILGPLDLGKK